MYNNHTTTNKTIIIPILFNKDNDTVSDAKVGIISNPGIKTCKIKINDVQSIPVNKTPSFISKNNIS